MATMYPEVFPRKCDPTDPEFAVYQILRKLPAPYHVFYSKRINGGLFGKPECEIDFIIFNGRDVVICLEVKGGAISLNGSTRLWLQNGGVISDVIKQATDAMHTLHRAVSFETKNACVDWALCFPDCCLSSHNGAMEVHPAQIIDEKVLTDIEAGILKLEAHIRSKYPHRAGMSSAEATAFISRLTRSIGFVQILGVGQDHHCANLCQTPRRRKEGGAAFVLQPGHRQTRTLRISQGQHRQCVHVFQFRQTTCGEA
jgi:hypothetical protein